VGGPSINRCPDGAAARPIFETGLRATLKGFEMDLVIEILLRDTHNSEAERKIMDIMDLASDGFKGRERVAFDASADALGVLASMSGGTAKVRVCKIE